MKKFLNVLVNLVLVICVSLLFAVTLAPPLFGLSFNTILSGSMEPDIKTGGVVIMEKVGPEEVKVGDVIGFKVEGMDTQVCHRVIEIVETEKGIGFKTKGDANEDPDPFVVKPENLKGRVIYHLPWLGYAAQPINKPFGFGLLVGLPALIIIVLEIRSLFRPESTRRKRPTLMRKPSWFPAYLSLLIGLVIIVVSGSLMAGNLQEKVLGSFAKESEEVGQSLYSSERIIENKGRVPLVICIFSEDETVIFSEDCFKLSSGRQKTVEITGNSKEAVIKTGCFFPILPKEILYRLFVWNSLLAPFVVTAVWIFPFSMVAFLILRPRPVRRAELMKRRFAYE